MVWAKDSDRLARVARSTLTPVRSICASTAESGRSSVSYTVVTASAASRGLSTSHSRSPISVSSPAYSAALATATWSNATALRPVPITSFSVRQV